MGSNPTWRTIGGYFVMFYNVVIGEPLIDAWQLISLSEEDFIENDKRYTLFTNERFLPAILVQAGVVKSKSEVRRNKPDLCVTLDTPDCLWVKWGKHKIYIIVGV